MASGPADIPELSIREQIARIDQLQADAARKREEYRFAPWTLAIGGLTAGAAIFAAGAAFMKVLG